MANRSIDFFDEQFRRQIGARDFALNPFEHAALPFLKGRVLDLGCGLGNLAIAAARQGAHVVAVDASLAAVVHVVEVSRAENLGMTAVFADVSACRVAGEYDTIVAIGLLTFLAREPALELLSDIAHHVVDGGCAVVNVLVEGTTYMEMFDPGGYCLFRADELASHFAGWKIELSRRESFPAAGGTVKEFSTVIARKLAA